jgi:hypothetical protein
VVDKPAESEDDGTAITATLTSCKQHPGAPPVSLPGVFPFDEGTRRPSARAVGPRIINCVVNVALICPRRRVIRRNLCFCW